ncbi:uncharacterized protein METZ01_LOCUS278251 [marine metagenome]|uniref:Uncharacterized protein n=1 Tax=marine metagenome TaxID=408172 RepID=A0A382KR78_9ZZZZ
MEELRGINSEQLKQFLEDARDLHGKYGNPGKPTLNKLLDPVNGSPNPPRITEIISLFENMYFDDLGEMVLLLENEIERRESSDPSDV